MNETRAMHYVPKVYLKNFSRKELNKRGSTDYFIHALYKPFDQTNQIIKVNIKKICIENDIYALPGETKEDRQLLENMYDEVYERNYDRIYSILTDESRNTITTEERFITIGFVVSMLYRNNTWGNQLGGFMDRLYEQAYRLCKQNGKDSFEMEGETISIAGKTLEEFQIEKRKRLKQIVAATAPAMIIELKRLRMATDVITILKLNDKREFVTSDNPVSYFQTGVQRVRPADPMNTMSMALDSKHLLQLRPWAADLDKKILHRMNEQNFMSDVFMSAHNNFQLAQSGKFMLGNKTGLAEFHNNPEGIFKGKLNAK